MPRNSRGAPIESGRPLFGNPLPLKKELSP